MSNADAIDSTIASLPALLTRAQVAELMQTSMRSVQSWESRGLLKATRPCGGSPRYLRTEVERVLREGLSLKRRGRSTESTPKREQNGKFLATDGEATP